MKVASSVRVHRVDSGARPAVLVAAWLVAELSEHASVRVDSTGEQDVVLAVDASAETVLRDVAGLLIEPRFRGWTLAADPAS